MRSGLLWAGCVLAVAPLVSGCRISSDKKGDGDNVKVATPFGGMSVKTNDAAVTGGIGLPEYPGATAVKKSGNDDAYGGGADLQRRLEVGRGGSQHGVDLEGAGAKGGLQTASTHRLSGA